MKVASRMLIGLAAIAASPVIAHPHEAEEEASPQASSEFVGRYDGSAMETAMGMIIREDGTFQWGISVGALDLRAEGTWFEEDGTIIFVSDPKPVPAEFGWSGLEKTPDGPLVKVVWSTNGEPFRYGSIRATCANGETVYDQVHSEGWSPPNTCDAVEKIQLRFGVYDVVSEVYDLVNDFPLAEGETIRFEFRPNDMGVADFDGTMGQLRDGVLVVQGPLGGMELRKLVPPSE